MVDKNNQKIEAEKQEKIKEKHKSFLNIMNNKISIQIDDQVIKIKKEKYNFLKKMVKSSAITNIMSNIINTNIGNTNIESLDRKDYKVKYGYKEKLLSVK